MNKYYIAFAFQGEAIGFGDTVISSKNKFEMNTVEKIEDIKKFILEKLKEKNSTVKNVTIMDFRELEE